MNLSQFYFIRSYHCRYPSAFIAKYYRRFCAKHHLKTMQLTTTITDTRGYHSARRTILHLPTASQSQQLRRVRDTINDPNDATNVLVENLLADRQKPSEEPKQPKPKRLIVHYHHERRLTSYKRKIHHAWTTTFDHTPLPTTHLIVGNRNHSNLKRELIREKSRGAIIPPQTYFAPTGPCHRPSN